MSGGNKKVTHMCDFLLPPVIKWFKISCSLEYLKTTFSHRYKKCEIYQAFMEEILSASKISKYD